MKNALALMGAMAVAGGCSEPKTEQPQEPTPAPVEIVDRGVDTPQEAQSLVQQWQKEGFTKLAGLVTVDGTAILWDPTKCAGTKPDYANGVMLTGMKAVSAGIMEVVQPVHSSLHFVGVQYLRICDDGVTDLTGQPLIPVQNSGGEKEVYETLANYIGTMVRQSGLSNEEGE